MSPVGPVGPICERFSGGPAFAVVMISAPVPRDEQRRLAALAAYDLRDRVAEAELDDVTRLAAAICRVPIALVSIVECDRQWFKSRFGLTLEETPRDVAFCAHAILGDDTMVVEDARRDERFHDNPLVTGEPFIRFYAGVPLVVASGERIGTLCVIDREPRSLDSAQLDALRTLARHVVKHLEVRRLTSERSAAEDRFRMLSDAAPVGIYLADGDGSRLYTNSAWQQMSGLTFEESLGHGWLQAIHPGDRDRVLTEWASAVAEQRDVDAEFRFVTREGNERYIVSRAKRIDEPHDGREKWVGSITDITERRRTEEMLDRFFRLSVDMLCVSGVDGYFKRVNPAFTEVLGFSEQELLARPYIELVHPDDREKLLVELQQLAKGRPTHRFESRCVRRDGSIRWIAWSASAVTESGLIFGAARDVTSAKIAAQALAESEDRYRDLFENATDLIQAVTPDWKFLYVNQAWLRTLGYTVEELSGMTMMDVVHPDSRDHCREVVQRLMNGELVPKLEAVFVTSSGEKRLVEGNVSCRFVRGRAVSTRGIFRDVTESRAAERDLLRSHETLRASESAMRSIISSSLSGIVTFSRKGLISSVSPAAETILGYPEADLLGRDISQLLPEPPADFDAFLHAAVHTSLGRVTEWDLRRGDGSIVSVELALFEFETADGKHLACNLHDISQRREVEKLKREFVATVSHELRTPLTSIRGSLDLLKGGVCGPMTPQGEEVATIALRNTMRLITLINEILDLDRLDSGKLEMYLADAEMESIVRTAADSVRAFAEQSGIRLITDVVAGLIHVDAERIVQVLVNLLSNAIKFSPPGAPIRLTAQCERGEAVFRISDRGRGIPRPYLQRIFDRFQQVDSSDSRSRGGSGLGLAICKGIVEQHHGTIDVVSEEGTGSTFTVRLPLRGGDPLNALEPSDVLIVEDDPALLAVLRKQLERDGVAVRSATSGREALALMRATLPRLLVLDIGLPDIDGFDLIAILRGDSAMRTLPLLVCTARYLGAADRACLTLGPTRFLTKTTADDRELRRLVAELITP